MTKPNHDMAVMSEHLDENFLREIIVRSFKICGISNAINDTEIILSLKNGSLR